MREWPLTVFPSRKRHGRYEYEIEPGHWVSRQRVNQLRDREAHTARTILNQAVRREAFVKPPCEVCGAPEVQAHHYDYSCPMAVSWLCLEHHRQADAKLHRKRRAGLPIQPSSTV